MSLATVLCDVLGIHGSSPTKKGPPPLNRRKKLESSVRAIQPYIPTRTTKYVLLSSEIQTPNRRSTTCDPIPNDRDGAFSIQSPIKIGEDPQGFDIYTTGILEKAMSYGYDILIILDEEAAQIEWMHELGIPNHCIVNTASFTDSEPNERLSRALIEVYQRVGLSEFAPKKSARGKMPDPLTLLNSLRPFGILIGTNVPEPLPTL